MFLDCPHLSLARFGDDDSQSIVLVKSMDALRLCRDAAWEEVSDSAALWDFEGESHRLRWKTRTFALQIGLVSPYSTGGNDWDLIELVGNSIKHGQLVGLRKCRAAPAKESEPPLAQRRLVRDIEAQTGGRIVEGGRQYKLAAGGDVDGIAARNSFEVVGHDEAGQVLDAIAKQLSARPAVAALLAKARDMLSRDWHPPLAPDGLVLLRKIVAPRVAASHDGPAITPSQMKAMLERTWYEILLVDEVGQALSGVELRIEIQGDAQTGKTDGEGVLRVRDAARGDATVHFADAPALLDMLNERWDCDREEDWIVPPGDAEVLEVCRAVSDWRRPLALQAETTKVIVLEPPYWVRLFDEQGQPMPNLACTIALGDKRYNANSDRDGWIEFPVGEQCPESATVEWEVDMAANAQEWVWEDPPKYVGEVGGCDWRFCSAAAVAITIHEVYAGIRCVAEAKE
jgi:hypothetical protein